MSRYGPQGSGHHPAELLLYTRLTYKTTSTGLTAPSPLTSPQTPQLHMQTGSGALDEAQVAGLFVESCGEGVAERVDRKRRSIPASRHNAADRR